jgi:hypothetical protein
MIGQFTNDEFFSMFENAITKGITRNKTYWIKCGKYTYNYYIKHGDNSWTNYDCKTIY